MRVLRVLRVGCVVHDCCYCCNSVTSTNIVTSDGSWHLVGLNFLALSVSDEQECTEAPTFGCGSCGGPGSVIDEGMDEDAFVAALLDA